MTKNVNNDVAMIALKCQGLGFPVFYQRSECGPRVRTHYFTQQLDSTAPLARVINKSEDIAFACGVESVMITRVRNLIAVQVPLDPDEVQLIPFDVGIHNLLMVAITTQSQGGKNQQLPIVMGQTITGENYTVDLVDQPHLLIAGSTGGGKSVFQGVVVSGLILAKSSEELELFLIDTKQLDLPLFKGAPQVKNIVDKIEKVHDLLDNMILNVRRRTERMKGIARNIAEFNNMVGDTEKVRMKYKVVVIDELADVIAQDKDLERQEAIEIEQELRDRKRTRIVNKIQTLTQISRASGIHVIAATQRPSVKLMSGDIKANFPMRLTFRLPTSADSRVILGEGGAENLLGKGDYLYQTFDMALPVRGHGAYVSTTDIARIVDQSQSIRKSYELIRSKI